MLCYFLLEGDTAMPGGLYAGFCHTFLVISVFFSVAFLA